jgi:hypothetical protein
VTHDEFRATGSPLNGLRVDEQVFATKLRLTGDAVYDQDSWAPRTAVRVEFKRDTGLSGVAGLSDPEQLSAGGNTGTDLYLSAHVHSASAIRRH